VPVLSPPAPHLAEQRPTASRRRTRLVLAAMLFAVLTLSGCYKADVNVTVNRNDTMSGDIFIGVGPTAGSEAVDSLDPGTIMTIVPGAVVTDHKDNSGYRGRKIKFTNVPLDSLSNPALKELVGVDIKVTRSGEQFILEGSFDGTLTQSSGTSGAGQDATQIHATFSFPGPVGETNGTVGEDNRTVTWAPAGGEKIEMTAVAAAVPANLMLTYVAIGAGSLLVLVLVVLAYRRFAPEPTPASAEPKVPVAKELRSKTQPKVRTRSVKAPRGPVETHDAAPARQIVAPPTNWWSALDEPDSDGNQASLAHGEQGTPAFTAPNERTHP
jgi:hypothetical protein